MRSVAPDALEEIIFQRIVDCGIANKGSPIARINPKRISVAILRSIARAMPPIKVAIAP
jgi:hypothetical protein